MPAKGRGKTANTLQPDAVIASSTPTAVHTASPSTAIHPVLTKWLQERAIVPFPFQTDCWAAIAEGKSGLLNAPTGAGKTYAILLGLLNKILLEGKTKDTGLHILWLSPLKALASDFYKTLTATLAELAPFWQAGLRFSDTTQAQKAAQKRAMPQILVTTPESLQLLISQKAHAELFSNLEAVVVDEWHELLGSKRGVQTELGMAHLDSLLKVKGRRLIRWGISATIGNLAEAAEVLSPELPDTVSTRVMVKAQIEKTYRAHTVLPDTVDSFPWSGHLGLNMVDKVLPLIEASRSCLLFCNTRAQAEMWYQTLLLHMPDLAGQSALHHGSLERDIRTWVEEALREGRVKLVVTTSSLDLGVDFAPVDRVIQIGSPKGVGRMMQRAGRSGHRPGAVSEIFLIPTNSLEIIEFEALKDGMAQNRIEGRPPLLHPLDVLLQYMMTLAIGAGFTSADLRAELATTHAYRDLSAEDFSWCLHFLQHGGESLTAYDEYAKLELNAEGKYVVESKRIAMRHRMSMGTIVGAASIRIKFVSGGYIGSVEENFVTTLKPGDTFWFAGRALEFVQVKGLDMLVKKSNKQKGVVPRWGGGRMPLTSNLSELLRKALGSAIGHLDPADPLSTVQPLLEVQARRSAVPGESEFLCEHLADRDGMHLFFYPFEGRVIHEILAALIAWRITQVYEATFSLAYNDYGFELFCDQKLVAEDLLALDLFSPTNLRAELERSINHTDLARHRFREVATIAGMVFTGFPGQRQQNKHLQMSSNLLYDVFRQYEPDNKLLSQAYEEVFNFEVGHSRLLDCLERVNGQKLLLQHIDKPTPLCFPILTDRLREKLKGEDLERRIERLLKIATTF
jgi:ATP-dependent helicase Lhr and Lhr-like helicase